MPHNNFFFDDDLEAAERQRRRGNPLLGPAFQAAGGLFPSTPLDVAMGEASPERVAEAARAQREALEGRRPLLPPQGPVTLTLDGEVLDENIITSTRALDSLCENPNVPQLVNDRMMVASPQGVVRIIPERGEDPAMVERFKASSLLPGALAPTQRAPIPAAPTAPQLTRVSAAPSSAPFVTRANFTAEGPTATQQNSRTLPSKVPLPQQNPSLERARQRVLDAIRREDEAKAQRQARIDAAAARERAQSRQQEVARRMAGAADVPQSFRDLDGVPQARLAGHAIETRDIDGNSLLASNQFVNREGRREPLTARHILRRDAADGQLKVFEQIPPLAPREGDNRSSSPATRERLGPVPPDVAPLAGRMLIDLERQTKNAFNDIADAKLEKSLGEGIGELRQDFGEGFVKRGRDQFSKLPPTTQNLIKTIVSDPVNMFDQIIELYNSDPAEFERSLIDATTDIPVAAIRATAGGVASMVGSRLRRNGVSQKDAKAAENVVENVFLALEVALLVRGGFRGLKRFLGVKRLDELFAK